MNRKIIFGIAAALLALIVGIAGSYLWSKNYSPLESFDEVDISAIPVVDYCEMRNNPEKYSGRVLRTHADLYGYQHGIFFYDENCWSPASEKSIGENFRTAVSFYTPNRDQLWESVREYLHKKDVYAKVKAVGRFTYDPSKNAHSHPYGGNIQDRTAFQFEIHSIEAIDRKTR